MTQVRAESSPVELQIDARDWSGLVFLSVLWGGTFFFIGVALKELPPFTLIFLRVTIASLILLPVLWGAALNSQTALPAGDPML